jgi:hypothetical protein
MSTQSGGFDITAAKPVTALEDEGQTIEIRDINGEPMTWKDDAGTEYPVTVTVAGSYSTRYRRAQEAQVTRAMKRRNPNLTGEALGKQRLEVEAACVLAWSGFFSKGKPWPCERENVITVLEAAPWIREQIAAAIEDHAGFFKGSSGG